MKSVNEAQAETPELNLNPMSALSPLHEWKKIGRSRSYRLPDSLCNGAVKLFALVAIVVCLVPHVDGEIRHSDEPNGLSRCPRYSKG